MCKAKRHYRKRSSMLSGVIGRHQFCDDRGRFRKNRASREFDSTQTPTRSCHLDDESTVIRKTTIEDTVSETTRKRVRRLYAMDQTQVEQYETYSATVENQAQTEEIVEIKVVESKPKPSGWKWLLGFGGWRSVIGWHYLLCF